MESDEKMPFDEATLHLPFRDGYKDAKYGSYTEFADECGIPLSTVNRFLAGTIKSPSIFYLAAMARAINARMGYPLISLDELTGIGRRDCARCAEHAGLISELDELRAACEEKDRQISMLTRSADVADEKISIQRRALDERRPTVALLFVVIFMLILLLTYVIVDASNPQWGLFRY